MNGPMQAINKNNPLIAYDTTNMYLPLPESLWQAGWTKKGRLNHKVKVVVVFQHLFVVVFVER